MFIQITKPLLERQRRARINRCLDQLKDVLVSGMEAQGENVTRLEKADILELTVRHLQKLQASVAKQESQTEDKFRAGFVYCAQEVSRVLATTSPRVDIKTGSSIMIHLGKSLNEIASSSDDDTMTVDSYSSGMRPYTPPLTPLASPKSVDSNSSSCSSMWRPW